MAARRKPACCGKPPLTAPKRTPGKRIIPSRNKVRVHAYGIQKWVNADDTEPFRLKAAELRNSSTTWSHSSWKSSLAKLIKESFDGADHGGSRKAQLDAAAVPAVNMPASGGAPNVPAIEGDLLNTQLPFNSVCTKKTFSLGDVSIKGKLGEGGQGVVYQATWKEQDYALKVLSKTDHAQAKASVAKKREIDILRALAPGKRPEVIELFAWRETLFDVILLFPLYKGSLRDFLIRQEPSVPRAIAFTRDLIRGVEYVHGLEIIHRDIKPGNMLVASRPASGGHCDSLRLLIADFGSSRFLQTKLGSMRVTIKSADGDRGRGIQMTRGITTAWYRAPEMFLAEPYSLPCDIWSLGASLVELETRRPFFNKDTSDAVFAYVKFVVSASGELNLSHWRSSGDPYVQLIGARFGHRFTTFLFESLLRFYPSARRTAGSLLDMCESSGVDSVHRWCLS